MNVEDADIVNAERDADPERFRDYVSSIALKQYRTDGSQSDRTQRTTFCQHTSLYTQHNLQEPKVLEKKSKQLRNRLSKKLNQ